MDFSVTPALLQCHPFYASTWSLTCAGTGTASIRVKDINDMPPMFTKDEWFTEVDETDGVNLPETPILTVTVHDEDETNKFQYKVNIRTFLCYPSFVLRLSLMLKESFKRCRLLKTVDTALTNSRWSETMTALGRWRLSSPWTMKISCRATGSDSGYRSTIRCVRWKHSLVGTPHSIIMWDSTAFLRSRHSLNSKNHPAAAVKTVKYVERPE